MFNNTLTLYILYTIIIIFRLAIGQAPGDNMRYSMCIYILIYMCMYNVYI